MKEVNEWFRAECDGTVDVLGERGCGVENIDECLKEDVAVIEVPRGVRKDKSGKWVARIRDPESKERIWLGTHNTAAQAVAAFAKKKTEFKERFMVEENVKMAECDGMVNDLDEPELRIQNIDGCSKEDDAMIEVPLGVRKNKSVKLVVQMRDPVSKGKVWLRTQNTAVEAVSTFDLKKTEFKEKYKVEEKVQMQICNNNFKVKKVPSESNPYPGVSKSGNKWQARVWHPKLKFDIYLGMYNRPEEAAIVVKKKKAEFQEFMGEDSKNVNTHRYYEGMKLPSCVYRRNYKRFGARIWDPNLKRSVSLGSYSSPEEAAAALKEQRALFKKTCELQNHGRCAYEASNDDVHEYFEETSAPENGIRTELINKPWKKLKFSAIDAPAKLNYGSLVSAPNEEKSCNAAITNRRVVDDVPCKQQSEAVLIAHSVIEEEKSNIVAVSKESEANHENQQNFFCDFNLVESKNLGIVNEYGQLMGEYSNLDEMWLNLPDEDMEIPDQRCELSKPLTINYESTENKICRD